MDEESSFLPPSPKQSRGVEDPLPQLPLLSTRLLACVCVHIYTVQTRTSWMDIVDFFFLREEISAAHVRLHELGIFKPV